MPPKRREGGGDGSGDHQWITHSKGWWFCVICRKEYRSVNKPPGYPIFDEYGDLLLYREFLPCELELSKAVKIVMGD